jgi:hypothetical protein
VIRITGCRCRSFLLLRRAKRRRRARLVNFTLFKRSLRAKKQRILFVCLVDVTVR